MGTYRGLCERIRDNWYFSKYYFEQRSDTELQIIN